MDHVNSLRQAHKEVSSIHSTNQTMSEEEICGKATEILFSFAEAASYFGRGTPQDVLDTLSNLTYTLSRAVSVGSSNPLTDMRSVLGIPAPGNPSSINAISLLPDALIKPYTDKRITRPSPARLDTNVIDEHISLLGMTEISPENNAEVSSNQPKAATRIGPSFEDFRATDASMLAATGGNAVKWGTY